MSIVNAEQTSRLSNYTDVEASDSSASEPGLRTPDYVATAKLAILTSMILDIEILSSAEFWMFIEVVRLTCEG